WSGTKPTSYAYEWQDCDGSGGGCVAIAGATGSTYTLVAYDQGHTIRVKVTGTSSAGSAAATSLPTALVQAVAGVPTAPVNIGLPVVSGTAAVGQSLSTTNGTWTGTTPIAYAYKWQDCDSGGANCSVIAGATASTYTLTAADQGHTIRAVVTGS